MYSQDNPTTPPPNNPEVELSIIGAMILDEDSRHTALSLIDASDLYNSQNQRIFKTIEKLSQQGLPVDVLSIEKQFGEKERPIFAHIATISTRSASLPSSVAYHCQIVKEAAIRRSLIKSSYYISDKAHNQHLDLADVLDYAESSIASANTMSRTSSSTQIASPAKQVYQQIIAARDSGVDMTGLGCGLSLDEATSGWQPGDLIIIAGRPSMGKTAFVLHCIRHLSWYKPGKNLTPVHITSMEMNQSILYKRMIGAEQDISIHKLNFPKRLFDNDLKKLEEGVQIAKKSPIYINDNNSIDIDSWVVEAKEHYREKGVRLFVIDYLQLFAEEEDVGVIGRITRKLKKTAEDLQVPIIVLSQLSRGVESRPTKRPIMSDLRASGNIEQDADVVIFLYRPEYYNINEVDGRPTKGMCELIIAKQRNGPTVPVRVVFQKWNGRFLDEQTEPHHVF